MKKKIIFFGFNNEYESMDIRSLNHEYIVKHIYFPKILVSILLRIKRIAPYIYIKTLAYLFKKKFAFISDEWILICNDNEFYSESIKIKHLNIKRKIIIIRNTFQEKSIPLEIDNVEYYSFDINDCLKYKFNFYNQYCSGYNYVKNKCDIVPTYTAYFLGLDKGRSSLVSDITKLINGKNKVIIVKQAQSFPEKIRKYFLRQKKFKSISYLEHLNNVKESRLIIDIVKPGQSGLTMRPLEALLNRKKVITNNTSICLEPFYHPDNVLIIEDINLLNERCISSFLAKNFNEDPILYSHLLNRSFQNILSNIIENK